MAKKSVLGLYTEEDSAADALDNLRDAGFEEGEYELLTGTPYPEGTFGEAEPEHHLFGGLLLGQPVVSQVVLLSQREHKWLIPS